MIINQDKTKNEINDSHCSDNRPRYGLLNGGTGCGCNAAPVPAQDPIVQHLKLTQDQVTKIKSLHQQLEKNVQQISQKDIKDGVLFDVIDSGKWNEKSGQRSAGGV